MRRTDCGNVWCVRRGGQPIEYGGPNPAAAEDLISRPGVAGHQQHDALSGSNRAIERLVDRSPGLVQITSVKVQYPVRFDRARTKPFVPARIERFGRERRQAR
jgi:hypothetical protein